MSDDYQAIRDSKPCAQYYAEVDISASDYEPTVPFRAINTASSGAIEIVGLDGVQATVQLTEGTNPLAGLKLISSGSVVTSVTVLR